MLQKPLILKSIVPFVLPLIRDQGDLNWGGRGRNKIWLMIRGCYYCYYSDPDQRARWEFTNFEKLMERWLKIIIH